jgi:hypothetical protein
MLSFFAFCCCCCRNKTASEALKKKNLTFRKKKSSEKLSAFSSCFVTNSTSDHTPQFNHWNEDGGESVASKRRTRSLFAQKRRKKRSSFIFRRFFGTEFEERRERRARAKNDKQTKNYQFQPKTNGKIIDKNKIIISLTVFRRYQQKPICSCACGVRRSRLENNRRISFL